MTKHPITPPPEMVEQWSYEKLLEDLSDHVVLARAAQWGADQELERCITNIHIIYGKGMADWLRSMRRCPAPPSAVAQAETLIERHKDGWVPSPGQWHTIREGLAEGRRALEALPND